MKRLILALFLLLTRLSGCIALARKAFSFDTYGPNG